MTRKERIEQITVALLLKYKPDHILETIFDYELTRTTEAAAVIVDYIDKHYPDAAEPSERSDTNNEGEST